MLKLAEFYMVKICGWKDPNLDNRKDISTRPPPSQIDNVIDDNVCLVTVAKAIIILTNLTNGRQFSKYRARNQICATIYSVKAE